MRDVSSTLATHCNALQHTATHCNTLQHTAPHFRDVSSTPSTHCNALQHTATHCTTLHRTAMHCNTLQHATPRCKTLQHNAPYCTALVCVHGVSMGWGCSRCWFVCARVKGGVYPYAYVTVIYVCLDSHMDICMKLQIDGDTGGWAYESECRTKGAEILV